MTALLRDLRFAARSLARAPGLALVGVLVLGLGLGAATVVYGAVDAVLIRAVPYPEPERLVVVHEATPAFAEMSVAWPNFEDYRGRSRSFEHVAAMRPWEATLTGVGEPEYVGVYMFSAGMLATLGVEPQLGREFTIDEERPGSAPVAMVEHAFWQTRLGGDPEVIGRTIVLSGKPHTIVGVLPPDFEFVQSYTGAPSVVVVSFSNLDEPSRHRGNHPGIYVLGRLAPGVTLAQARDELRGIGAALEQEHPEENGQLRPVVVTLSERLVRDVRGAVLLLAGAVLLVVLVAIVNVAGLLLARGIARQKELAVRAALGAGRRALVRQLLAEALVLALAGGLVGLLVALWGLDALGAAIRASGLPLISRPELNGAVLGVSAAGALGAGALAGLLPALALSEPRLHDVLKAADLGASGGTGGRRARTALVVAEIALAFVLVAGAAMSVRGLQRLYRQDLGLEPRNVLTFGVPPNPTRHDSAQKLRQHFAAVEERLRAVPGVEAISAASALPFTGQSETSFQVSGAPRPPPGQEPSANYFFSGRELGEVLGLRLVAGRFFGPQDEGAHLTVVVNESLARAFFPDGDAVGRYLEPVGAPERRREIVGVVRDVPSYGLAARKLTPYQSYYPLAHMRDSYLVAGSRYAIVAIRTSVPPLSLVGAIRAAVREVDPDQAIHSVRTLEDLMRRSVLRERIAAWLLGGFAAFAVLLASIGLYGLVSHGVARRTRELGLRMALGASPQALVRSVLGQGVRLTLVGLAVGLVLTLALARAMSRLVAGSGVVEPALLAALGALLVGVAALASFLPARRATRIDPGVALREE